MELRAMGKATLKNAREFLLEVLEVRFETVAAELS